MMPRSLVLALLKNLGIVRHVQGFFRLFGHSEMVFHVLARLVREKPEMLRSIVPDDELALTHDVLALLQTYQHLS